MAKIIFLIFFLLILFSPFLIFAGSYEVAGKTVIYQGLVPCGKELCQGKDLDEEVINKETKNYQKEGINPKAAFEKACQEKNGKMEFVSCEFCHFLVLLEAILKFIVWRIVPILVVLMLIVLALIYFFSFGSPQAQAQARALISNLAKGLLIVVLAWFIVNLFMAAIGYAKWAGLKEGWFQIKCEAPTWSPPTVLPTGICAMEFSDKEGEKYSADGWCIGAMDGIGFDFCKNSQHYWFKCKNRKCDPNTTGQEECSGGCLNWDCTQGFGNCRDGECKGAVLCDYEEPEDRNAAAPSLKNLVDCLKTKYPAQYPHQYSAEYYVDIHLGSYGITGKNCCGSKLPKECEGTYPGQCPTNSPGCCQWEEGSDHYGCECGGKYSYAVDFNVSDNIAANWPAVQCNIAQTAYVCSQEKRVSIKLIYASQEAKTYCHQNNFSFAANLITPKGGYYQDHIRIAIYCQ